MRIEPIDQVVAGLDRGTESRDVANTSVVTG
jgi:hypothetical protein